MITEYRILTDTGWRGKGLPALPSTTPEDPGDPGETGGIGGIANAGAVPLGSTNYAVPGSNAIFVNASSGLDSNAGTTAGAPKKTFVAAYAAVPNGGTIVLRQGNYYEGGTTQSGAETTGIMVSKTVTIQPYPGEVVWFDGSDLFSAWTSVEGRYRAAYNRLYQRSPTFATDGEDGVGAGTGAGGYFLTSGQEHACWSDMVFWDGVQLEQVQTKAELASGKFWVEGATTSGKWFQASQIWIYDNPAGHEVRVAMRARSFTLNAPNIKIRGIGFRRYATTVGQGLVWLGSLSTDSEFSECVFEDIATTIIRTSAVNGSTFTGITCRRIGFSLIQTNRLNSIMMDRIDMQQINTGVGGGIWNVSGPAIAAIKICKAQNVTIQRSIFKHVGGSAIWFDQTVANPYVLSCWIEDCAAYAIDYEGTSGGICADVMIKDIGKRGYYHHDSDQLRCWNITVTNAMRNGGTGGQFMFAQSSRNPYDSQWSFMLDSSLPAGYYDNPAHQFHVNSFECCNNVGLMPVVGGTSMWYLSGNSDTWGQTDFDDVALTMKGNLYWWATQPQYPFVWYDYGQPASVYFNLNALRTAHGSDKEQGSTLVTGAGNSPVNSSYQVINPAYHANASGLPSDIANLIGRPAGVKRVGCWLVGDAA